MNAIVNSELRIANWSAVSWMTAFVVFALTMSGCNRSDEKPQRLPKSAIAVGGRTLEVEVALTPEQRGIGMMHRRKLAPDEGMLFVFAKEQPLSFWMKNTHVALSIAFIAQDGRIVNIANMEPLTLTGHPSRLPAMYALEMPLGWFENNRVKEGDVVVMPEAVKAGSQ